MNKVFTGNLDKFMAVYLDDILIFIQNQDEHWSTFGGHWANSGKRSYMGDFISVSF